MTADVERFDCVTIQHKNEEYTKIGDRWYLHTGDSLECEYTLEHELDERLEELEEKI